MKVFKALIIDDEPPAREVIKYYLKDEREIQSIGECENGFQGVKMIQDLEPDLIFLDIQMPKLDGFEMLELIDNPPLVIFCTAYDQYAIKAFEKNAVDYLLKPFSHTRFHEALEKAKKQLGSGNQTQNIKKIIDANIPESLNRIVVKNGGKIDVIDVDNILFLESQDDYVEIHTRDGKKHLKNQRMKYYEDALDSSRFIRVHRRFILNISELSKLEKFGKESYVAILKEGQQISVSLSGYSKLKELLDMS